MGIRAVGIVFDAPAAGGFCEGLGLYEKFHWNQAASMAAFGDSFLETEFHFPDFTDFDGCMASGFQYAMYFAQHSAQMVRQQLERAGASWKGRGIDSGEPTPKPVVASVIDDIQKWRRCDYKGSGVVMERARCLGKGRP